MAIRVHSRLHSILLSIASENKMALYHQPPTNLKMQYPCIVYMLSDSNNQQADNINYIKYGRYQITVITRDPNSTVYCEILDKISYCVFSNLTVSDNLYHYHLYCYEII